MAKNITQQISIYLGLKTVRLSFFLPILEVVTIQQLSSMSDITLGVTFPFILKKLIKDKLTHLVR